jgi:hypothetical protein
VISALQECQHKGSQICDNTENKLERLNNGVKVGVAHRTCCLIPNDAGPDGNVHNARW